MAEPGRNCAGKPAGGGFDAFGGALGGVEALACGAGCGAGVERVVVGCGDRRCEGGGGEEAGKEDEEGG